MNWIIATFSLVFLQEGAMVPLISIPSAPSARAIFKSLIVASKGRPWTRKAVVDGSDDSRLEGRCSDDIAGQKSRQEGNLEMFDTVLGCSMDFDGFSVFSGVSSGGFYFAHR